MTNQANITSDLNQASPSNAERVIILEAGRTERNYWSDLWSYRELFAILAWRDVAVLF